eukprot:366175-Chlamydomonas_euryale.AAC.3
MLRQQVKAVQLRIQLLGDYHRVEADAAVYLPRARLGRESRQNEHEHIKGTTSLHSCWTLQTAVY